MVYPRKLFVSLKKHLKQPQVTVITGMRRVGKTTLVKQLLDESTTNNKHYFDLERVDNRELFSEKNFDNIIISFERLGLSVGKRLVIALDEIQLLPQITGVIKYLYDKYKIKFIVTGSSSYYLKNLFRESLSGRKKIF
ncbi:MAG TPA: AAA family ATPase [Candidatus Dojkabacteria bacterium]|nr:AAA family ATPase [Candidatus Dojkabacteria bacterium]